MESNPDKEETKDVPLENERERHWKMIFDNSEGGLDDVKALLHAKKWYVYLSEK